MKWFVTIIGLVQVLTTAVYAAGEPKVNIVLNGAKEGIELKKEISSPSLKVFNPQWLKANKNKALSVLSKKALGSEWQEFSLTFKPMQSGKVVMMLKGPYFMGEDDILPKDIWVAYDSVEVSGAKFNNGDFEKLNKKKIPSYWWQSGKPVPGKDKEELVISDSGDAHSGNNYVKGSINEALGQTLVVTAEQVVTITFRARAFEQ